MMARQEEKCPIPVVSSNFCFPHSNDLEFSETIGGSYGVNDSSGELIFKVKRGSIFAFGGKRVILDAAGLPILTLRSKVMSMHSRWNVFRGESKDDKDLIFSARRSSMFQLMKTKLHVFLANNKLEDICDCTVQGSSSAKSCEVYFGNSSTIIAQMHKNTSPESIFLGKGKLMVRVYPNIDRAFIVALIIIFDDITTQSGAAAAFAAGGAAAVAAAAVADEIEL